MTGAPIDDAALARGLVEHLQARGALTSEHLAKAAQHFASGRLPTTALLLAGVNRAPLTEALAAVTGLARAPDLSTWSVDARRRTQINDAAWGRARAVPFGMKGDRLLVAFADPKVIASANASLPPHDAFVCLEDDVDTALLAAASGATLIDARVQPTLVTPPPALPSPSPPPTDANRTEAFIRTPSPHAAHPAPSPVTSGVTSHLTSLDMPARIGPFIVDGLLARGGMGTVYDAHDEQGRRAAVKVVHPHLLPVADVRARFVREAQATQRIDHPNIVRVLGVGTEPAYLAVEFLEGGTVGALLERHGKLPLVLALELFAQMVAGLAAAHAQAIVHRDLKPDNLLLSRDGVLKIADFGIARELDATAMTQTGSTLGTPAYMSPEQARAEPVDPRSDLYTAGVILYELLAGRNPFMAESLGGIIGNILRGNAPPLFEVDASVPDGIEALVSSLMNRDRDARPKDAEAVLALVRPIVDDVRRLHPRLAADVMARPARVPELVREQADTLVDAARVHLQGGVAHREAAALCLFRARLLVPEHVDARALLDGLAQEGVAFGAPSAKLADLERELASKPDDAVLLQRAAQLARQEGNVYKAAIYFRRYLRVRPDDNYVRTQADKLTLVVPASVVAATMHEARATNETQEWHPPAPGAAPREPQADSAQSTMLRIAGHIAPGGFVASAPVAPPSGATQRMAAAARAEVAAIEDTTPGGLAAAWSVHKTKLIAAAIAIVVVVGGVKVVRGLISGAQRSIDSSSFGSDPTKPRDPDADEVELKAARVAFAAGNWSDVDKFASSIIARRGAPFDMSEALVLRGKARLGHNRALAAVEDFTRVIEQYGNQEQAVREAFVQRGVAYVKAGDRDKAKDDLTRALGKSLPPLAKARAHLERGLIALDEGDVAAARADLEKAETYTPPADETHKRAIAALERLPK